MKTFNPMMPKKAFTMTNGKIGVAIVGTGWMGGALPRRLAARDDATVCFA